MLSVEPKAEHLTSLDKYLHNPRFASKLVLEALVLHAMHAHMVNGTVMDDPCRRSLGIGRDAWSCTLDRTKDPQYPSKVTVDCQPLVHRWLSPHHKSGRITRSIVDETGTLRPEFRTLSFVQDECVAGGRRGNGCIEATHPPVRQVDRRGEGGIIFAPGCAFKDHGFAPYTIAIDLPIATIPAETFWHVWDLYGKTRYEERAKDPAKRASQRHDATVRKARASGKRDVPPAPRAISHADMAPYLVFPPCVAQLMVLCDRGEHLFHDERVFLASFLNAEGFDPEGAIEPLFARQPDHDAAETAKQVGFIVAKGYKPRGCRRLAEFRMCPGACGRTCPR